MFTKTGVLSRGKGEVLASEKKSKDEYSSGIDYFSNKDAFVSEGTSAKKEQFKTAITERQRTTPRYDQMHTVREPEDDKLAEHLPAVRTVDEEEFLQKLAMNKRRQEAELHQALSEFQRSKRETTPEEDFAEKILAANDSKKGQGSSFKAAMAHAGVKIRIASAKPKAKSGPGPATSSLKDPSPSSCAASSSSSVKRPLETAESSAQQRVLAGRQGAPHSVGDLGESALMDGERQERASGSVKKKLKERETEENAEEKSDKETIDTGASHQGGASGVPLSNLHGGSKEDSGRVPESDERAAGGGLSGLLGYGDDSEEDD